MRRRSGRAGGPRNAAPRSLQCARCAPPLPHALPPPAAAARQALVDAPEMTRRIETFKRLTLTDMKLEIPRLAAKKVVVAKWSEAGAQRARWPRQLWPRLLGPRQGYAGCSPAAGPPRCP